MWIYNVNPCIREKNIPVCIVFIFIYIYLLLLLYRNVNSESIEIFFHIKWKYKFEDMLPPPFAKSTLFGASLLFWFEIKFIRCHAFTNLSRQRLVCFNYIDIYGDRFMTINRSSIPR